MGEAGGPGGRRVMVIGLDSAPPATTFDRYLDAMPNLAALMDGAAWGPMRSCHPPITVPAWAAMATGRTPGELGMYGFRHRRPGEYGGFYIVTSENLREPAVWDAVGAAGGRSLLLFFPPSYPPRRVRGWLVSDFHTPSDARNYTYPAWLRVEVERILGGPVTFDVPFRVEDRGPLLRNLFEMTLQHLKLAARLAASKRWDLMWYVEIGLDRFHHAFWKYFDPSHPKYEPGNEFEGAAREYYALLDEGIGTLLKAAPDAAVLVVSDHGAKAMRGALAVNEWLADQGYLAFEDRPSSQVDLEEARVDWDRTVAWGWGGYYARIFLNLRGREPRGRVDPEDAEAKLGEIADDLRGLTDPEGRPMRNEAYRPSELYGTLRGDYPDMFVYFDDLNWRSAGTVGHGSWYLSENDKGPDDAVHDWDGIFLLHDPEGTVTPGERRASIYDVAPTVLDLMGLPAGGLRGRSLAGGR